MLRDSGAVLFALVTFIAATSAALHALLFKRDPRSAIGWIAVSVTFPLVGPALYYVLGINRIRTRAKRLHADVPEEIKHRPGVGAPLGMTGQLPPSSAAEPAPVRHPPLDDLVRLGRIVTRRRLTTGNSVKVLHNGEEAYPPMIAAICGAERCVYLATYIFETNATGRSFIEALSAAVSRGVTVRVLVDGVGELYGWPRVSKLLARAGVPSARFLPPRLLPPQLAINLRNHRKIVVVDGRVAFTGGMNIGDRHLADDTDPRRVTDVHFRLHGPVVRQIESVFLDDWEFTTDEALEPSSGRADATAGTTSAHVVVDGPDEDLDRLAAILIGALGAAQHRVWIMTPYFLPPRELIAALKAAALRGTDVRVILPAKNNLPYVHWASRNILWELLHWGVRVFYQPAPFAHSKLLLVDEEYVQIGSANIDPRSLRLNFELTLELYDRSLVATLDDYAGAMIGQSREVTFGELERRHLGIRIRDAVAGLFIPYL
ncbi:MAG TPA: cardiolipin synthase [Acidobacteriota bacterium]|nr:cardiolipin synthase [Acidobacteriota bacterium]